jgi:tetratricopeptide (TPR) repeat protein
METTMKGTAFAAICTATVLALLLGGCTAYMRGNTQLSWENYDAAIAHYRDHLARNPEHWQARERLGYAYLQSGNYDAAIAEFNHVLEQRPGEPTTTYYLGMAYLRSGRQDRAIETWKTYRNEDNPELEREIQKQLTLLEISESIRLARQALADEARLQTSRPASDTVAVFYFKDTSEDSRFRQLQKAMAALIISDLSQIQSLEVLERTRVQFLLDEMQLGKTGIVEQQTAPRVGHLLGAENLVVGTLEPGSMEVNTSVASTTKNDVVAAFGLTGEKERFYALQKEIVYNLLKVMNVDLTEAEQEQIRQYHTRDLDAVLYFGQGLDALDAGEWKTARNYFEQAAIEDPSFQLARLYKQETPNSYAPSIQALAAMSVQDLAQMVDNSMSAAMSAASAAAASSQTGNGEPGQTSGDQSGSVSVSW